ncbi:MAG: outer membrane protein/protective antigen OMA87-like protein, partial [Bryobacterales bacterium]|nr:outer membrane protein/protective antigen OMA87-like protein [Bryobacterales bacterium]
SLLTKCLQIVALDTRLQLRPSLQIAPQKAAKQPTLPHHSPNRARFERPISYTRLIIYLGLLLPCCVFADNPLPSVRLVKSVAVHGANPPVKLATQEGRPYDATAIEQDVRALWSTGRFEDIRVESTADREGVSVIFHLVNAPEMQLHEIRIEPSSFGLHPKIAEGTVVTRSRAFEIALEARKHLNAEGYTKAWVDHDLLPSSGRKVDLRLTVHAGEPVNVKEVELRGNPGLDVRELSRAMRATHIRRVFPKIPGVWDGWRLFPAYNPEAVNADLNRLRSLYLSKGYFDASVQLASTEIHGTAAKVSIAVESGPRYQVREWTVAGSGVAPTQVSPRDGTLQSHDLCTCLFTARREANRRGVLDFDVRLDIRRTADSPGAMPAADLTAGVEEGQPYRIRRIEFTGNHRYGDATVRRNLLLNEGQLLDERLLRRSIERLNQNTQFEHVDETDVSIQRNQNTGEADVVIGLRERKHRAWAISGPLGPLSFAGPLTGSLSTRLPPWGQGLLELSTYTASVSLVAFANPLAPFLSVASKRLFLPTLVLERAYSPAEGWKSGFFLAPQLGWSPSVLHYATTQIEHRILTALTRDSGLEPELPVTVENRNVMFCEPPTPRSAKVAKALTVALQLLGAIARF